MLNRVFLIGNLTRDPEVRYSPSGTAVTTFGLAVSEKFRDRNQELREETLFIRVDTFQRLAETCAQYLKKGKRVLVEGKLRLNSWEGKDGVKHSRIDVHAFAVRFLDTRPAEGAGASAQAPAAATPAAAARPAERARVAEPEPAEVADQPFNEEVPEHDINAPVNDSGPEQPGTEDDLPF